jgi:hypothetical protein
MNNNKQESYNYNYVNYVKMDYFGLRNNTFQVQWTCFQGFV